MTCWEDPGKQPSCVRLGQVTGHLDKHNEMLFYGSVCATQPARNIVYFPGDVQDYPEAMHAHPENCKYIEWNLESTASRLVRRFPNSHVWVVKPASMQLHTYSVFSHFVHSDPIGVPVFGDGQKSWHHLKALMVRAIVQTHELNQSKKNMSKLKDDTKELVQVTFSVSPTIVSRGVVVKMAEPSSTPIDLPTSDEPSVSNDSDNVSNGLIGLSAHIPLTLIGFSKGCVVLNQLLHDVTEAQNDPDVSWFLDCVDHVFWLDGGHNGGCNAWVVHDRVIDKLLSLDWHVHVHVTPYQVRDSFRKWIGVEHTQFLKKLQDRKLIVESKLHFVGEERSLENHFRILEEF